MSNKKKTFYEILNLNKDCKPDEIKKSFIKLSKQYHPDKNLNMKYSHETFSDICEAYNTLRNPLKRKEYDDYLLLKSQVNYDSNIAYGNCTNYGSSSSFKSSSNMSNTSKLMLKLALFPKGVMFVTLVLITLFSAGFKFHFTRTEFDSRKAVLENKSLMLSLILDHSREQARIHGREGQLKRLQQGLLGQYDVNEIVDKYIKDSEDK